MPIGEILQLCRVSQLMAAHWPPMYNASKAGLEHMPAVEPPIAL